MANKSGYTISLEQIEQEDLLDITELSDEALRDRAFFLTYQLRNGIACNDEYQAGLISEILTEEAFRHLYGDIREEGGS
jgi:hypothetical protein